MGWKIPQRVAIAVSGGIDSMVALDFLRNSRRKIQVLHFNHATPDADNFESFVREYCKKNSLPLTVGKIQKSRPSNNSIEEFWRNER